MNPFKVGDVLRVDSGDILINISTAEYEEQKTAWGARVTAVIGEKVYFKPLMDDEATEYAAQWYEIDTQGATFAEHIGEGI